MITKNDLRSIIKRKGFGIKSSFGGGSFGSEGRREREESHLESASRHASLLAKAVSLNYSGICEVRIRFFRKRLADYSRAISEKAIIDALVYAGALNGDSESEICLIDEGQHKVATDAEERTEVVISYPAFNFDEPFVKRTKFGNMGERKAKSL